LLGLIVVTTVVHDRQRTAYLNSPEGKAETAKEQADADREAAQDMAQMDIGIDESELKVLLRDPDSAEFTGARHFKKDGKEITCGYVNSKNAFGGMAGMSGFAVIDHQVHMDDFGPHDAKVVDKACR
jgi:hypothetical protein